MNDFNEMIPEMKAWNNGQGVDVHTWIDAVGTFQLAIGYSTIFWPEFTEVEGFVFRAGLDRQADWRNAYGGDRRKIEALANHIHIDSIHYSDHEGKTPQKLKYLARILQDIYICKLTRDFPSKYFRVEVSDEADSPVLTFYQVTKAEAEQCNRP